MNDETRQKLYRFAEDIKHVIGIVPDTHPNVVALYIVKLVEILLNDSSKKS